MLGLTCTLATYVGNINICQTPLVVKSPENKTQRQNMKTLTENVV